MKKDIILLDATLREGEQQHGIRFSKEDKIQLLQKLEDFGVKMIEVGHPSISEEEEEICRAVADAAQKAEVLMHARAQIGDVHAVYRARADWIGIWASINPISLQTKFTNKSAEYVMQQAVNSIHEAKKLGLKVRFTIEDASRTDWNDIQRLGLLACSAGADRISLADTVGIWEPQQCTAIVKAAVETFPCEIEVHLHNDLGLASANALAAIDAGATVIDTTLCGIGERAGIVDLLSFSAILAKKRDLKLFNLTHIPELARTLQLAAGCRADHWRPIIGKDVFTHIAPYHIKAIQQGSAAYEGIPPETVGRTRKIQGKRTERKGSRLSPSLRAGQPFIKGASELKYHRDGYGIRWVHLDHRTDDRTSFYVIQRVFPHDSIADDLEGHVDVHAHHCDSAFIFWGSRPDGTGLVCEVEIEGEQQIIESPKSVFIPAGLKHSYRYLSGSGTYTNIVLAPEYNDSLLEQESEKVYEPGS
nr:2-isopropylmalate synthase [uncultured Bacillus sp.]